MSEKTPCCPNCYKYLNIYWQDHKVVLIDSAKCYFCLADTTSAIQFSSDNQSRSEQ